MFILLLLVSDAQYFFKLLFWVCVLFYYEKFDSYQMSITFVRHKEKYDGWSLHQILSFKKRTCLRPLEPPLAPPWCHFSVVPPTPCLHGQPPSWVFITFQWFSLNFNHICLSPYTIHGLISPASSYNFIKVKTFCMWFAYFVKHNYLWDSSQIDVVHFYDCVQCMIILQYKHYPLVDMCLLFFLWLYVGIIICLLMHICKFLSDI